MPLVESKMRRGEGFSALHEKSSFLRQPGVELSTYQLRYENRDIFSLVVFCALRISAFWLGSRICCVSRHAS